MNNNIEFDTSRATRKRIALFGATGGIGRRALEQALAAGHEVTALVRASPDRLGATHPRLATVVGDVTDYGAVLDTVRGCDAVVIALGAPALSTSRVRSTGTQTIVAAMKEAGVDRVACVSLMGAAESFDALPFVYRRLIFPTYLRRPVAEHNRQEQLLRDSGLDWTIARPPNLTDGPATDSLARVVDNDFRDLSLKVSRADVAQFLVDVVATGAHRRQAVTVAYRR